jgi:GTP cyclohydrolase FolE2
MVKREDEQAFAELNAANPIFVEDAARLFAEQWRTTPASAISASWPATRKACTAMMPSAS